MVFDLIPIRPNPREHYQKQVKKLCNLLMGKDGSVYRVHVLATLLTIPGITFHRKGLSKFHEHPQAKRFLRLNRLDTRALDIVAELDNIYSQDPGEIDNLRGAVLEVFSYFLCRKTYPRSDIEVTVKINRWISGSIDTAGCSDEKGHCLQCKCSLDNLGSILTQKSDFDKIDRLSRGKAKCFFVTYVDRKVFHIRLKNKGLDPSSYYIWDRGDLFVLENRLAS